MWSECSLEVRRGGLNAACLCPCRSALALLLLPPCMGLPDCEPQARTMQSPDRTRHSGQPCLAVVFVLSR